MSPRGADLGVSTADPRPSTEGKEEPPRDQTGTAWMWGVGVGVEKIVLFHILLHQWLENFYLTSANIGNRKMNSAEFHK